MADLLLYVVGLSAAAFMAFNIGANDAANPIDTAVGSGALSLKRALALFSVFSILGALLQGSYVMKTIGSGIVQGITVVSALVTVAAAGLWIMLATLLGLPISTSQSIAGAVLGVGVAYAAEGIIKLEDINWSVVTKIVSSWIVSPAISMGLALVLYLALLKLQASIESRKADRILLCLHVFSLSFAAYAFGANDVANATGVYVTVTQQQFGIPGHQTMLVLALLGGVFIAFGGFTLGRRVVETTAYKITKLDNASGVAAGLSLALTVWLFTTVPYALWGFGLPISTTHTSVTSIIGAGMAKSKGLRGLNVGVAVRIMMSWLLTLPVTMCLAFCLHMLINIFL
ncbi:MAG: inorganic phosphate transporter [Candidatus Nezhaarchaeota archaeon]|nr:inorganic phosphate transporter [Candidatus Nezhaarchaeota archaeon]